MSLSFDNVDQITELELFARDVDDDDLRAVARLPALRTLRLLACRVPSLAPLVEAPLLEELEVNFCPIEHAEPLLAAPALRRLRSFGTPWSKESYEVTFAQLEEQRVGEPDLRRIVERASPADWELTRRAFESGTTVLPGLLWRTYYAVVQPGSNFDYREGNRERVVNQLASNGLSLDRWEAQPALDRSPSRFRAHWTPANRNDLARDVALTGFLDDELYFDDLKKEGLFNFGWRFCSAPFYREDEHFVSTMAEKYGVDLPRWYRTFRSRMFAGVAPMFLNYDVTFGTFQRPGLLWDGGVYEMGWVGYDNPDDRPLLLDKCGLYPIANGRTNRQALLAINVRAQNDLRIYDVPVRDLRTLSRPEEEWPTLCRPVFDHVGTLHDAITRVAWGDKSLDALPDVTDDDARLTDW